MENITKVSDITVDDLAAYLRLEEVDQDEENTLQTLLGVAKNYILNYTGQTDVDAYQDFVIVAFILCQDMYDNRTMYVDKMNVNKTVDAILGMHSVNLLPETDSSEDA
jgi:hypothetical protein